MIRIATLGIVLAFCVLSIGSSLHESLTYDEIVHLQEGRLALLSHTFALDTNNPPFIRELTAIPLVLGLDRYIPFGEPMYRAFPARLITILLSCILLISLYIYTRKQYGHIVAALSVFFLAFHPMFLANNHLVTLDMGLSLFFFLSYWCAVTLNRTSTGKQWVIFGCVVGMGLASKVSFIPFFAVTGILYLLFTTRRFTFLLLWQLKWKLFLCVLISLLTVWATYCFTSDVVIRERQDSSRISAKISAYAEKTHNIIVLSGMNILEHQPIPLGTYIAMIKNNAIRNTIREPQFFLGKLYETGQWYFILVHFLLKTPIPFLLLVLIGIWNYRWQPRLFAPILAIMLSSASVSMKPMVRYMLPVLPYLSILAAMGSMALIRSKKGLVIFGVLLLWLSTTVAVSYPHFISYANEALGTGNGKYVSFVDSNGDWGQSLPDVAQFKNSHPDIPIRFSYNGRDDGSQYGLNSNRLWGSYKAEDICAFHTIPPGTTPKITLISITNWYYCGYYLDQQFPEKSIQTVIGKSVLQF